MLKSAAIAVAIMFTAICLFGAKVASAQQVITLKPGASAQLSGVTILCSKAVKAASAKVDATKASVDSCGKCSQWETDRRVRQLDAAAKGLAAVQRAQRAISARVEALKSAIVVDRRDIEELRQAVAGLEGLESEDRKQISSLLTEMSNTSVRVERVETRTTTLESKLPVIETRTTTLESKLPVIEEKVDMALGSSISLRPEFTIGYANSFAAREVILGAGATLLNRASGDGVQMSFMLGLSDADKPRLTSGALRIGYAWALGGPNSSLIGDFSGHVGIASQNGLSVAQEGQAGIGVGLKMLDLIGPLALGARIEHTWGMNSGPMGMLTLSFSPGGVIAAANQPRR